MIKFLISLLVVSQICTFAYSQQSIPVVEQGTFLVHRRQLLIGEENYTITKSGNFLVVNSSVNELERSTTSISKGELRLNNALQSFMN